ncbi:MAG: 5-methyltetrahydropteroyltriglutamate--homocysteine S-methyltransferase, partial [Candidatus Hydrothermarchaeales archaeon]
MVTSYAFGFPRLGKKREYKKVIENYWKGQSSEKELREALDRIQNEMLMTYARSVDRYPVGEMTFYDPMFDTA